MKNKTILCTLVAIVAFGAGYFTNQKVNSQEDYEFIKWANSFKKELTDYQWKALDNAEKIMMKNDLFDEDGSDEMYEYMLYKEKVDSMLDTQL